MQDSLGLMQFHDHHQYLYSSSSSNLPLQQPLLSHHHRFLEANEGCAGEDDSPEFVEPPAAAAAAGTFEQRPELGACKEVYSEEGGAAEERTGVAMAGADVEQVAVEDEEEAHGVRMIALLMECAAAMSVGNLAGANGALLELSQMASPYAASCGERLVAYFARAMAARLVGSWVGVVAPMAPPPSCGPSTPRSGRCTTSRRSRGSPTWRATRPSSRRSTASASSTLSTSTSSPAARCSGSRSSRHWRRGREARR